MRAVMKENLHGVNDPIDKSRGFYLRPGSGFLLQDTEVSTSTAGLQAALLTEVSSEVTNNTKEVRLEYFYPTKGFWLEPMYSSVKVGRSEERKTVCSSRRRECLTHY